MDAHQAWAASPADSRAIAFTGTWREYLPIAASNVLLTIVTLGIYRFWAAARQRRYLWSRTRVIDDTLEWSGSGKEMFIGFLLVSALLLPFFLFVQFAFPALMARGMNEAAGGLFFLFYVGLIYLGGVARFRALRYRLSRTWWRGIRGGSNEPGWNYGGEFLGRHALSAMTMFIMFPWAATRLWNSRWNEMSFGALRFRSTLDAEGLKGRWAMLYLVPLGLMLLAGAVAFVAIGGAERTAADARVGIFGMVAILFLLIYLAVPLLTLNWYAAFYRKAAAATSLGDLDVGFDATTWDWFKLFVGNLALAVFTLGLGLSYWGFRNWAFMIRHAHLYGEINVSDLSQSTTVAPGEAEGFADAFEIGAI
jgi:uncharacterized membrane protein YjgN (DUF898 family)